MRSIVDIAREHPRVIFLLITNGLLLDEALIAKLTRLRNVVPVLSIEGNQAETDERRGRGVHDRLREKMEQLRQAGIFFSLSMTVTRSNFETVTDTEFLENAVQAGCKLFFHMEYTPIRAGTEEWVITDEQRESMKELVASFRARFPALFIAVPWDEEEQGGCLASGRGFVHISATGDLEPCPFAPYSDTNILAVPLRDARAHGSCGSCGRIMVCSPKPRAGARCGRTGKRSRRSSRGRPADAFLSFFVPCYPLHGAI